MDQGFLVVQELYTGSVFNHIVSHRLLCFNVTHASTVEAQIQLNIKLFKRDGAEAIQALRSFISLQNDKMGNVAAKAIRGCDISRT
jgi:hypothetical protein